jgi:hypothetical protein
MEPVTDTRVGPAQGGRQRCAQDPVRLGALLLQGKWALVRATLKDGRVVGGFFGPGSFAGYTAEIPDLYLERRYVIDPDNDWFGEPVGGTLGLYIRAEEIVSVEFYEAGGPEAIPRWWRRAWSRISNHGATSEQQAGVADAPNSQAGRDLAGRSGASGPDDSAAGAE